jgi:hypothetical protein
MFKKINIIILMLSILRYIPHNCFTSLLIPKTTGIFCNTYISNATKNIKINNESKNISYTIDRNINYITNELYFNDYININTLIRTNFNNINYIIKENIEVDIHSLDGMKIRTNYSMNINEETELYLQRYFQFIKFDNFYFNDENINLMNFYNKDTKQFYAHINRLL